MVGASLWRRYLGLLAVASLLGVPEPADAAITYIYDQLGRLRAVVDPASDTAIYTYDAVGNILSITRQPSSQVAIIEFNPTSGPVSTSVTISGTGFSVTASQNTVTFNGVTATVTSATITQLVATVPTGATTGPIGVTAPGGSATSVQPFTVTTASSTAPTITSFTPTIGTPGTSVTLTGTQFESTPGRNNLRFEGNGLRAIVSTASATSLTSTVPGGLTASGPISVATPGGKAVSSQDFFVPVGSYTTGDIVTTLRMAIGQTQAISIPTANKVALVIFDATAGQKVSFSLSSGTIANATMSLYQPDGIQLLNVSTATNPGFVNTQTLPVAGTYSFTIAPGSYTGTITLTLNNANDLTASITPNGAAVTVTIGTPGQNARVTFSGTAGRRIGLKLTNVTFTFGYISVLKPDGSTLVSPTAFATGDGFIDSGTLPSSGVYTILVDPLINYTGSMTLTLYDFVDVTGTITPGGAAVGVTIATPGQNARLTFSGTAGQRVSLLVTDVSITQTDISILKPDASVLVTTLISTSGGFIDTQTLPTTGTYTLVVDPRIWYTGSLTLTLYNVPADVTGTITPGGAAVTASLGTPGQNGTLTFSGAAGQRISLLISNVTIPIGFVSITNPDASTLISPTFVGTAGAFFDTRTLNQTGTYTILINPFAQYTGAMTLTLYDVPADVTGSVTIGGSALTVTITTPGQNATVTFSGTASQQATVHITSNTAGTMGVTLKKPDGSYLTSGYSGATSFNLPTVTLPVDGTYSIFIDLEAANTGSLAVSVTSP